MAQETRFIAVDTPLGDDLRLVSFAGREEISRLFSYHLDMVSPLETIKPEEVVGKATAIRIDLADGTERYIHGFLNRFSAGFDNSGGTIYQAELVPFFWFLTQTSDCRIFQNKKIPDITEGVFKDTNLTDYRLDLQGTYRKLEYRVQFRETDFNFLSRLMEEEGIFYYYEHEESKHTLVLADHVGAYKDLPESTVEFPPSHHASGAIEDHITDWRHDYEFTSGKWAQSDYNFKKPSTNLIANESTKVPIPTAKNYEVYDYPGEYVEPGEGKDLTRLRMEEEEVAFDQISGSSTCRTFNTGGKFSFGNYPPPGENGKTYVVTSVSHRGHVPGGYETGGGADSGPEYSNTFTCISDQTVFRPTRSTPKPLVSGIQTALVVGPKGEEIHCDEYGRVKVHFYWDRYDDKNEKSSCWIRVSHSVAGKKWGFMAIPRIGQEVVVDFLNGDADQPLIVGSVYNKEQMPHYALPEHFAKSYIKTNSTKGGEGFNELMLDDAVGEERLYMHAQKNMDVAVLNDSRERIYGNRDQIIGWEKDGQKGGDQKEMVWQDKHLNVKRNQIEHIEGNLTMMVGNGSADDGGKTDIVVEKKMTMLIGEDGVDITNQGDEKKLVKKSLSLTVGGDQKTKNNSNSLESSMDIHHKAGMNYAQEAGMNFHIKAGMNCVIEAGVGLTIKAGGSYITLGPSGIMISGTMVLINSGGAALSGSGCSPKSPDKPDTPEFAEPTTPAQAHTEKTGYKSAPD